MIPSRALALPSHAFASHMHDDPLMTNTSPSVLCCSRDYPIIALSYSSVAVTLPFPRISTGAITGIQLLFSSVFFQPVLRLAATPRALFFSFRPVVNIPFYYIAAHGMLCMLGVSAVPGASDSSKVTPSC